jgi:hypothetical protein
VANSGREALRALLPELRGGLQAKIEELLRQPITLHEPF